MGPKVLVIGSGAIGLRTALELVKRKVTVVLRSPWHPINPDTCSWGSGGFWMPFACSDSRIDRWAVETLDELHPMATDPDNKTVELLPAVVLKTKHSGPKVEDFITQQYKSEAGLSSDTLELPRWTKDNRLEFQHLTVEMLAWQNLAMNMKIPPEAELFSAGYKHAWLFKSPVVDPPLMLKEMLSQVEQNADVNVETGVHFQSLDEMREEAAKLGCNVLVNCTGLGASKICNDTTMQGSRGVMLLYDRVAVLRRVACLGENLENIHDAVIMAENGQWTTDSMPAYMIPRGGVLVVGGSLMKGEVDIRIRDEERQQLLKNAEALGIDTSKIEPIGQWTGFRPYRDTVRLEIDQQYSTRDMKVIHNYGHGGSGWTINVGAAKDVAQLILE
jgi:D-amino-acid oxidase